MGSKVLLVFTGGTISMRVDPALNAAVPVLSGQDILDFIPELAGLANLEVVDYAHLPGPHVTPEMMFQLSGFLAVRLEDPALCGAVVTHGTDTLEETACLLDLTLKTEKPVALMGAMKNSSEPGWDGPANLVSAVRAVLAPEARGKGVLVVMNGEIHAGAEVTKTHTENVGTFQSPNFGPLGFVDKDRVLFYRAPLCRKFIDTPGIEPRVDLIKIAAGMDDRLIRCSVDSGAMGIVVEALGRGNVPPAVFTGIEYAVAAGLPVVIVSRCGRGRVLDTYGYPGGGRHIRNLGVILGGYLNGQQARIQLMLLLGKTRDVAEIRRLFEEDGGDVK